jgi:hypothetical protein
MLEPSEEGQPEGIHIDEDTALGLALTERPEVLASASAVEARQYDERVASNQLLPRFDVVGSYGLLGLSGDNRPCFDGDTSNDQGCRVVSGPSPFAGSESKAYDRLASGDYDQYMVGLRVQIPIANAHARAEQSRSRVALNQAELRHRQLLSNVTLDVRDSSADVEASQQAIETSRVAPELAEENLRNQEKRHEVGMATTKDLLDFQTQLTQARPGAAPLAVPNRGRAPEALDALVRAVLGSVRFAPGEHQLHALAGREPQALHPKARGVEFTRRRILGTRRGQPATCERKRRERAAPPLTRPVVVDQNQWSVGAESGTGHRQLRATPGALPTFADEAHECSRGILRGTRGRATTRTHRGRPRRRVAPEHDDRIHPLPQ